MVKKGLWVRLEAKQDKESNEVLKRGSATALRANISETFLLLTIAASHSESGMRQGLGA